MREEPGEDVEAATHPSKDAGNISTPNITLIGYLLQHGLVVAPARFGGQIRDDRLLWWKRCK
jgi:hypothetical protein